MPEPSLPQASQFPERITLELTNKCNISCTFCPRHTMQDSIGFIDTEAAFRIIDEIAAEKHCALVPFFRGETLLHPDWHVIISYAVKKGIGPIQMATNGTLLTEANARRLLETGVEFVSFSLDTINPDLYNTTRRGADYTMVERNILRFLDLKNECNASIAVQVSAVETKEHKAGMDDFVAFWLPKVDRVRVYTEHTLDGELGKTDAQTSKTTRKPCHKLFTDMIIYHTGEVGICNHDWRRPTEGEHIGNVLDSSITEVWNSPIYQKLREAQFTQTPPQPCLSCSHWQVYYVDEHLLGRLYTK